MPALAVLAVLAVAAGVWTALPDRAAPRPAAAVTATGPTTTGGPATSPTATPATTVPTTEVVPSTSPTTEAAPTTAEATTAAPATTAPAPAPAPVPAPAGDVAGDPGQEAAVLDLVNQERAAAGCAPVAADAGLARVARAHSADMRDRGYFSHTTPDGLSPWDRAAAAGVQGASAENIAQGYGDAASVMAGWMDSPGHRANILDCSNTRLGTGVADGDGGPWWTQLFGR